MYCMNYWTHVLPGFAPLGQPEAGSWTLVQNVLYELMFYLDLRLSASLKQFHDHLYGMYCMNSCFTWICTSRPTWSRFMTTCTECTVWTHVLPEFAPLGQPEADLYPLVQNVLYKPLLYLDLRLSDSLKQVHEHFYGMYCMNSCFTWICTSQPTWSRFIPTCTECTV